MKKVIITIILVGMLGWAIFEFVSQTNEGSDLANVEIEAPPEDAVVGLNEGDIAPDFQLQTLDGEPAKLSDYRGHNVMVNFWATWCPPCRAEMPDMERFHQDTDIVILAVNITETESNIQDVEDFVDEFNLTFPILLDEQIEVADLYRIQPIPSTFMIDSSGIIQFHAFGPMNYDLMVQQLEKMS